MILVENVTKINIGALSVLKIDGIENFDTAKVFDCGQCFRFDPVANSTHEIEFAGCAHGKYISIAQDGDTLYIYNATLDDYKNIWQRFLGLDRDYGEINRDILSRGENPALADAVNKASGIRILKQEPWEAVCSFIISQNNNIPRIKKLVAALCRAAGKKIDVSLMEGHVAESHKDSEGHFYSFPSPQAVNSLGIDGLANLKTGFRAKYIFDATEKWLSGITDPEFLEASDTKECIEHLCAVKGIGVKVASCALLFGFAKLDAFPIDVWIKKVIAKYFSEDFDPANLGSYAGIAQQYLFYYERYLQSKIEE